ncbi:MAG: tail fiber domain-containing protein [Bacteroidales bacterium]
MGWYYGLERRSGSDQASLSFYTSYGVRHERIHITEHGDVGINTNGPTAKLSVNGSADKPGGGSWGTFSDEKLKNKINPYNSGLKEVLKINPVTYHYNGLSGYDTETEYVGVIAQELQTIAPEMVSIATKDDTEYLKVDNSAMTYMLINAVKEQQEQIEALKKEIELLKTK